MIAAGSETDRDVEIGQLPSENGNFTGKCQKPKLLPEDFLFFGMFGLEYIDGRPMICGQVNEDFPCFIYDKNEDDWLIGPQLKEQRDGGRVVKLINGKYLITGGYSRR